jgi:hypothetical protein
VPPAAPRRFWRLLRPVARAIVLAVLLTSASSCVNPSDLCQTDRDCNPGRACVTGRCRSARPADLDGAPAERGGIDAVTDSAPRDPADAGPPADGRCAQDGGCGWAPGLLPGIVLWLDAGFGVTVGAAGTVSRWQDRSGHENDAVQEAAYLRPALAPGGGDGPRVIVFRSPDGPLGLHLRIPDSPSLRWGRDAFTVLVVATSTNVQKAPGLLFRKRGPGTSADGLQLFAEGRGDGRLLAMLRPDVVSYETLAAGLTSGAPFVFGVRRTAGPAASLELRVNGHRDGRVTGADVDVDVSAAGADAFLGAGADETPTCCQLVGGIAEVIAVHGELSDHDLARLEGYLTARHGVPR